MFFTADFCYVLLSLANISDKLFSLIWYKSFITYMLEFKKEKYVGYIFVNILVKIFIFHYSFLKIHKNIYRKECITLLILYKNIILFLHGRYFKIFSN